MQEIEEEGHDSLRWRVSIDSRDRLLERGWAGVSHPERLAVQHGLPDRKAPHRLGDAGQRVRDLVQVPRVDAHLVVAAVGLDADAVELPLDQRKLVARHGVAHALGRGGEHREDRPEELESDLAQPFLTRRHGDLGRPGEVTREHQGPPRHLEWDFGRLRHRVRHHPGEGALAKLAGEEPLDEPRLVGRRPPKSSPRISFRLAADPLPVASLTAEIAPSSSATVSDACSAGRTLHAVHRSVPDADAALARHAGQKADGDRDLAGLERPQEVGEDRDLPGARTGAADLARGGDDIREQRHVSPGCGRRRAVPGPSGG